MLSSIWASNWARGGLAGFFVLVLGAVVAERLGYAGLWRGAFDPAAGLRQLGYAVPSLLYCAALWSLRGIPSDAGWLALARAIKRAGGFLAAGGLAALIAIPGLRRALGEDAGRVIDLDIASLVLAALGLALAALAARFEQAETIQADLDEMF